MRVVSPPASPEVAIYVRASSDQQAERQTVDRLLSEPKARASADGHGVRDDMLFADNGLINLRCRSVESGIKMPHLG